VIGATGVEVVGVGGSSPVVAAGVVPALAPFLFAGFWNEYQHCSTVNEPTELYLNIVLGALLLRVGFVRRVRRRWRLVGH
jgi:hypothetical protein